MVSIKKKSGYLIWLGLMFLLTSCASSPPAGLGLVDNGLAPCPGSSNCVCSEDSAGDDRVAPLNFASTNPEQAWLSAQRAVQELGGTVEKVTNDYLWATFSSKVFGFVDDLELRLMPQEGIIQIRSASRVGYSDFGVNRRRVESLRRDFAQLLDQSNSSKQ